jgi:uncharacterized membrane protein
LDDSDGIRDKFDYVKLRNGEPGDQPDRDGSPGPELTPVIAIKLICPACRPMSTTKQETRRAAKPQQDSPWPHVRLSETDRLETFSDSVLSITITLLVAEIARPEYPSGQLLEKLTAQWASYIAFLASFCYAGVIWLNHRAVFARVRYCDRGLHLANLFLLLTSGLIPFPTAILSAAIQSGTEFDARVAVTLYAAIAGSMCLAWLVVFHVLTIHHTLWRTVWVQTSSRRSVFGPGPALSCMP